MAYVFNPFTGNFDVVDTNTAAGSDTQVQFNDGGTLAGDTALTWNKTSDQLTVGGDINLDSGGSFSTTIQSVTPTANRTISFPDQTGTVGIVSGATGNIQYNNAGALAGSAKLNTELDWTSATGTYTGLKVNVDDGAGGAPAGTGNLLDLQNNGTSKFSIGNNAAIIVNESAGLRVYVNGLYSYLFANVNRGFRLRDIADFGWAGSGNLDAAADLTLYRDAADNLAQRRGTNAQTYRLYNTYTDASNYERGYLQWNSNVLELGTEGLGTGTARPVRITAATLNIPNLPVHVDEAAATTAGLATGDVYRTSTGELRIKL